MDNSQGTSRPKGRYRVSAMLVATGVLLAACAGDGSGPGATASGGGPKKLVVQMVSDDAKGYEVVKQKFEADNPGVTVELQTVTAAQYRGSNLAVLMSSNAPDVGYVPVNTSVYTQLVANQGLLPLDDVWTNADLGERYSASTRDLLSQNGKSPYVVALSNAFYNTVFYNKDLFAAQGVPEPADHRFASVDEFLAAAAKLKGGGVAGMALGGSSGFQVSWMVDAGLPTAASAEQMTNYLSSWRSDVPVTAKFTDPQFVSTLQQVQRYNDAGVFQAGFLGQDYSTALAAFAGGKAGMVLGGDFSVDDLVNKLAAPFAIDWALLPPVGTVQKSQVTSYYGASLGVPSRAKNPDLAKKFLELFMSDEMQQKAIVDANKQQPSVDSLPATAFESYPELIKSIRADVDANGSSTGWTATVPGAAGQAFIDPEMQKALAGGQSMQQVAEAQQKNLDTFREENQ